MQLTLPNSLMVWVIHVISMSAALTSSPKYMRLSYSLAILVVLAAFPFFFLGGPTPGSTKLFCALWDSGHIFFFIALAFALSKKFDVSRWRVCLVILVCVFLGGGLVEMIQAEIGRDGNWRDLLNDLAGTSIGLFWFQRAHKWVWGARILSVFICIPLLVSIFFELSARIVSLKQIPLLEGFESFVSFYGLKSVERSDEYHTQGQFSAKVRLNTGLYTGVSLIRLARDWSSYKKLCIDIYNPDPQLVNIALRVNDALHDINGWVDSDRFNQRIDLIVGWNHIEIPLIDIQHGPATRSMNLTQISRIIIYTRQLQQPKVIYVDNLRLE